MMKALYKAGICTLIRMEETGGKWFKQYFDQAATKMLVLWLICANFPIGMCSTALFHLCFKAENL